MTPKQQRFVEEYLVDLNASAAARRAGYAAKRADQQALENMRKPEIASAIAAAQHQRSERTKIDADWVLRRLAEDASADVADLYDANGHLLPVREWPKVWRTGLVAGIDTVQERDGVDAEGKPNWVTVRKIKLADRTRLVELLGKHVDVAAFRERLDVTGDISLSERIRRAEERAKS